MKLLRVERDGLGMYASSLFMDCTKNHDNDDNVHPSPWNDELLKSLYFNDTIGRDYLYCFANEKQLLQWLYLPEWRHKMVELGGKLIVVDVEKDYFIGEKQAVYKFGQELSRKEFPINSFDIPALAAEIRQYINS